MADTLFANEKDYGGYLKTNFTSELKVANNLRVATGYFGASLIKEIDSKLLKLVENGGVCKILIGMIFHGGVTASQKDAIEKLDDKLRKINPESGVYISRNEYHGKIYLFSTDDSKKLYVGSSNFSEHGFKGRLECTYSLESEEALDQATKYLDFLFSKSTTSKLSDVELKLKGKKKSVAVKQALDDCLITEDDFPTSEPVLGVCTIPLRVDSQPASSLNLYFDKGRKNLKGKYAPRPWYEVEITTSKKDRECEFYPKSEANLDDKGLPKNSRNGDFTAYINDGDKFYEIKMKVTSDYGKAIFSSEESGGRAVLGEYIKGKLERLGLLKEGERITSEILEEYGSNSIDLKKLDDNRYLLEF